MADNAGKLRVHDLGAFGRFEPEMYDTLHRQHVEYETSQLQHKGNWCAKLGIALVLLGILAIATMTVPNSVILVGWLLIVSGLAEAVHAFHLRNSSAFFFHFVPAIAGLPVGVLMVTHPAADGRAWLLVFASSFTMLGLFRSISAFQLKFVGWKWVAVDGAITLLLAAIFWTVSLWLVPWFFPLAVGISLILRGWSSIVFGMGLRDRSMQQACHALSRGQKVEAYVNRFLQRHSR